MKYEKPSLVHSAKRTPTGNVIQLMKYEKPSLVHSAKRIPTGYVIQLMKYEKTSLVHSPKRAPSRAKVRDVPRMPNVSRSFRS